VNLHSALEILKTLVGFDTTSRNSNLEIIDWIEKYLEPFGAKLLRVPSDDGLKTNLIASFGPMVDGGIVLSGHSDVVPIDDQDWSTDPWLLTRLDDKVFGRGTCDMKGFLACILAMAPRIAELRLEKPIYFAISYDEEVGCIGAPRLVNKLHDFFPRIGAVIVGEPTDMKVVSAHKGISSFIVEITGKEAHSSRTDKGVSAIAEAIPILNLIVDIGNELPEGNSQFSPPGTTMTVGIIKGGTAVNILAHHCEFAFDIRCEPHVDLAPIVAKISAKVIEIDKSIKERAPSGGAKLTRRSHTPGLNFATDSLAEQLARRINGDNKILAVSYAAEAGLFQRKDMPTIICGPGSILQAHQPDEYVEIEQLEKCISFLHKLVELQTSIDT